MGRHARSNGEENQKPNEGKFTFIRFVSILSSIQSNLLFNIHSFIFLSHLFPVMLFLFFLIFLDNTLTFPSIKLFQNNLKILFFSQEPLLPHPSLYCRWTISCQQPNAQATQNWEGKTKIFPGKVSVDKIIHDFYDWYYSHFLSNFRKI